MRFLSNINNMVVTLQIKSCIDILTNIRNTMSNRPRHPDKDIEAAIAHAEELG